MTERPEPGGRERAEAEFLAPGPLPGGANPADAEARLLAALEREIGVRIEAAPSARRRTGLRLGRGLAIAAGIVAVAALWWQLGPNRLGHPPTLRGAADSGAPGAWTANPRVASAGDGRVRLAWTPAPGATRYAVVFLAADLAELGRVDSLTAPALVLDARALPAGLVPGREALWRVSAYVGADEVGRSPAFPVTLP
jgi:hypothetical protein